MNFNIAIKIYNFEEKIKICIYNLKSITNKVSIVCLYAPKTTFKLQAFRRKVLKHFQPRSFENNFG